MSSALCQRELVLAVIQKGDNRACLGFLFP